MSETTRHLLAFLSIAVSIGAFIPYGWSVYRGSVRPHLVAWLIWTLLTAVVFFAQLLSGAGGGAWATGAICIMCLAALAMSFFRGEKRWTPFDFVCFSLTVLSIPLWLVSGSPLYSVLLLTFIEFLGFAAMTPKTWHYPASESLLYFILCVVKYALGAAALDSWSWETAFYPIATAMMAAVFSALIFIRRLQTARRQHYG